MRHRKQKSAFTIVEALIALAITAMLLTAVAIAFNASAQNYRENEKIFKTMNSARQAMLRMTAQLRTADCNSVSTTPTECSLIAAGNQDITYRYNGTDKKLYLVTNDDSTDSDYVLCDNVTAMTFTQKVDARVESVQIRMTVDIGGASRTVSSAAAIRRNLE